jgi:hypothetical protein
MEKRAGQYRAEQGRDTTIRIAIICVCKFCAIYKCITSLETLKNMLQGDQNGLALVTKKILL